MKLVYEFNTYDDDYNKSFVFSFHVKDDKDNEPPIWVHRDKKGIYGIDPEGGPFIGVGNVINGLKVKEIQLFDNKDIFILFYGD